MMLKCYGVATVCRGGHLEHLHDYNLELPSLQLWWLSIALLCILLCTCSDLTDSPLTRFPSRAGLDQTCDGQGSWFHVCFLVVLSFVPGGEFKLTTNVFSEHFSAFVLTIL